MSKPTLADLQNWFAWRVANNPLVMEPAPKCENSIADQPPISRQERIEIYGHAYVARLVEILEDDFKSVAKVVGEEKFWELVTEYLAQFPSVSPSVADLGKNFPSFLELSGVTNQVPYLANLATFEWALCEALYAETSEKIDPAADGEIPEAIWLQARVDVERSLKAFKFDWPVMEIWNGRAPNPKLQVNYVIVFRDGLKARFENLSEPQFRLLRMLQQGASIETALEEARFEDADTLNATFRDFMAWGVLARFDFSIPGCD